jgi:hypothetical protein
MRRLPPDVRKALGRSAGWAATYAGWIVAFKLLALTLVTYFLVSSHQAAHRAGVTRFDDISEVLSSNEVTLMGVAAILFVLLVRAFHPITTTRTEEIFTGERFEKRFLPGFLHGAVLAMGVALAFVLSGTHRYFGFLLSFDDAAIGAVTILVRALALVLMCYCEEFIFRHKLSRHLTRIMHPVAASGFVALLYCLIKALQFDLGVMHFITLFLISMTLSLRTAKDRDFTEGAGFLAALLIVFHPLLSLPVLGNEFTGLVMIKYQAAGGDTLEPTLQQSTLRVLTGGAGGPFSGLAFQILLILDIARGILRRR